jgi:hypothetical protein
MRWVGGWVGGWVVAGEKKTVSIDLTADELAFHDDSDSMALRVVPGASDDILYSEASVVRSVF